MTTWIKRISTILGGGAFFLVFIVSINPDDPFNTGIGLLALIKAFFAFFLIFLGGIILSDIILKGLVETIPAKDVPITEGGLIQHIREERERMDPEKEQPAGSSRRPRKGKGGGGQSVESVPEGAKR